MLSIVKNPKNEVYRELLDICFQFCDEFQLVLRTDIDEDVSDLENELKVIQDSFTVMKKESEWASTMLDGATADVYYFKTTENAKAMLKKMSNSLFEWQMPDLPEDLSFYQNGKVWMSTSSHEELCFIYPQNKLETEKIKTINGLKIEEVED